MYVYIYIYMTPSDKQNKTESEVWTNSQTVRPWTAWYITADILRQIYYDRYITSDI